MLDRFVSAPCSVLDVTVLCGLFEPCTYLYNQQNNALTARHDPVLVCLLHALVDLEPRALNTKVAPRNTASARRTGTLLLELDNDSADTNLSSTEVVAKQWKTDWIYSTKENRL